MASFSYDVLPDPKTWIRILAVEEGQADDPLKASLELVSLEAQPVYNAISYCWGSSSTPYTISICRNGSYLPFPITESLNFALRRFRHATGDRRLWADAICINQNDDAEKVHQVRLMGRIYTAAQRVLLYLGESNVSTPKALKLLEKIHKATVSTPPDDDRRALKWMTDNKIPLVTEPWKWEPLKDFFRRPWFRRKWVIQECTLASQPIFYCGNWEKDWEWMALVVKTIYGKGLAVLDHSKSANVEHANELQQGLAQLHSMKVLKDGLKHGTRYQLMDVVYQFQASRAGDPRDHLFALLGLVVDADDTALDPKYGKHDTVLKNCLQYARYFLSKKSSLEVLYRAGMQGHKLLAPSWIPDWYGGHEDFSFEYTNGLWNPLRRPQFYNIARGKQMALIETCDLTVLGVKGVVFDTVDSIANKHLQLPTDKWEDKDFMLSQKRKHLEESDLIMSTLTTYPTGESLSQAQWRALICNVTLSLEKAPDSHRNAYDAWRRFLLVDTVAPSEDAVKGKPFREVIDTYNGDKLFGATKAGFVGMFPRLARRDDVIAVLYGGEFPFVLRKYSGKGEANYELVGQCYVHGRMEDGQLDLNDPQFMEESIFLGGDYQGKE